MQQIGRYQVLEEIARGGMGVVFKALDPVSKRKVAIKVLLNPDPDPRFLQEIRALARLQHPGIVAFYDVAQDRAGRDVVVMELVEGESLHARIKRDGPLPLGEALDVAHQLAKALAYAHQRGVLHRDLKPHNVLVGQDGRVKLTDFGLGKVVNRTLEASKASLTKTGEVMGTPAYMPPEQAAGEKHRVGPASDVYSLGATLYASLTGRPPFQAETTLNLLYAVLDTQPDPPSKHRPEIPPEIDTLVLRCLAKDPAHRYPSAGELIAALEGEAEFGEPPVAPSSASRVVAAAGLVAAALAVALALALTMKAGEATSASNASAEMPAEVALERGRTLMEAEDHEGAKAAFDAAIRLDPSSPGAWVGRGDARGSLGDWQGQLEDCAKAIEVDPTCAEAYLLRGAARWHLEDRRGAIEDLDEAIRLEPDDARAYGNRGAVRWWLGDYQGAIEDYTEAIHLEPDLAGAYNGRAFGRAKLGDWQGAIEDCTEAIRLEPDNAEAHSARGTARGKLGDLQGAIEDCNRAIRLDPDLASAYGSRGTVRWSLGDYQGAVEDLERALQLEPNAWWAPETRQNLQNARQELAEPRGGAGTD